MLQPVSILPLNISEKFMVSLRLIFVLALLQIPVSIPALAQSGGISLGQTRVIFSPEDKSQSISVINSSIRSYLVQSRVQTEPNTMTVAPFIVTPPLFTLKGDSRQILRILPQNNLFPTDRESLFYLSISAIPALDGPVVEQDRLSVGLRFVLKLFYRPAGLTLLPEEAPCQLTFKRVIQGVQINNPTPYYQTLATLTSNGRALEIDRKLSMVAPRSSQTLPVEISHQVSWQTVTDYGGLSVLCHQSLIGENF
ncbi:fimbrial biogenesis chaperone [Providencia vermicola]|uniref:fimbrial biogenesis chaperone n=1 Tax=Providencia vermicola TaxID=333965 RepID=UPI0034E532B8